MKKKGGKGHRPLKFEGIQPYISDLEGPHVFSGHMEVSSRGVLHPRVMKGSWNPWGQTPSLHHMAAARAWGQVFNSMGLISLLCNISP